MEHPDYRLQNEQEMYEYYKSLDYSNVTDWSILFGTHIDYTNALSKMSHPFHKEAMQIKQNRINSGTLKPIKENYYSKLPTLVEDIENQDRYEK